jgi:hypothetical protein
MCVNIHQHLSRHFQYRICALKNCSYSQDDVQSAGKLYGYNWSSNQQWKLLFTVTGQSSLGQLGSSTAIGDAFGAGNDILAVSSPTSGSYFCKMKANSLTRN